MSAAADPGTIDLRTVDLGTYEVAASAADAAAFRAATKADGSGDRLPFTYPIRWMAQHAAHAAMATLAPEPGIVPFHESQTFDYAAPLQVGERYTMSLNGRRETAPDRLVVDGTICAGGARVATIETVLRLFSTTAVNQHA